MFSTRLEDKVALVEHEVRRAMKRLDEMDWMKWRDFDHFLLMIEVVQKRDCLRQRFPKDYPDDDWHYMDQWMYIRPKTAKEWFFMITVRDTLVETIALLAFVPGGVRLFGYEFNAVEDDRLAFNGWETETCDICNRTLTDPESIAKGRGPICSHKMERINEVLAMFRTEHADRIHWRNCVSDNEPSGSWLGGQLQDNRCRGRILFNGRSGPNQSRFESQTWSIL